MSDLHQALNDPSQTRESTLSFLFNAGEAGLYAQREIFQHLNIWDANSLRGANKRLDRIVRGVPIWATQDGQGNLIYTRNNPASASASAASSNPVPAPRPIRNSTLHWLGATCNGKRCSLHPLVAQTPCTITPLTNVQIKRCDGIQPPWRRTLPRGTLYCRGDVCALCVTSAATRYNDIEQEAIARVRRVQLCGVCQGHEARRHPNGYSSCICDGSLNAHWLCFPCRHQTHVQIVGKFVDTEPLIRHLHRDRQGRKIRDSDDRRRRSKMPCPGCARSFVDRSPLPHHVTCCMACKGVIVEPTLGPDYQPTNLMPRQPTRRSDRLAARYAAMPSLDFEPDVIR